MPFEWNKLECFKFSRYPSTSSSITSTYNIISSQDGGWNNLKICRISTGNINSTCNCALHFIVNALWIHSKITVHHSITFISLLLSLSLHWTLCYNWGNSQEKNVGGLRFGGFHLFLAYFLCIFILFQQERIHFESLNPEAP